MQGPRGVGQVVEQVIAASPQQSLRYRVIEGSPLSCHQGEITLKQLVSPRDRNWRATAARMFRAVLWRWEATRVDFKSATLEVRR
jgi:hypothetical protein